MLIDNVPPADEVRKLCDKLCELGYDARIANMMCFDIHIDHYTHYLSWEEAQTLSTAALTHPVDLLQYSERIGLNLWYTFPQV